MQDIQNNGPNNTPNNAPDKGPTYQFVPPAVPKAIPKKGVAAVGPLTAEKLAYLLECYEEQGVAEEELVELRKLLRDLESGVVTLPEPKTMFYEVPAALRRHPDAYEYVFATADLADPLADFEGVDLVPVVLGKNTLGTDTENVKVQTHSSVEE